ncbi:hypothetical protein [Gluconobacter sphaericus]|uniref:Uncharacterized protein n=1 Tax=Gluconobacter sphaericus NBRC 12467 TaxID=1307951 RepID=A0AA37SJH8_9PROT|nr:hypothetical protein [Gluconobacter sphaericus]MBF0886215.1 hypothetical protein [Gluconobacter sphaericus]GBR51629.1 hypothetical protein AA12467_0668 [Gluconobacter sphaericus NBRC 12467]GEB43356.1 hypothetical protein GSP01_21380 [Gluconobacter sphaericus NBRC 12467]GLQ85901.1 hypothetical protein GCM10007872_28110 [Gluconobacter sphaericus NBRC 12467]
MTSKDEKPSGQITHDRAAAAKEERESREAKALRANLMRRKQQQRARPQDDAVSPPDDR